MSFYARNLGILILTIMVLGTSNAELRERSGPTSQRFSGQHRRQKEQPEEHTNDHNVVEEDKLTNLSSATRRFLFSPMIQNTITNLNTNSNTQKVQTASDSKGTNKNSSQILGYFNNQTGAVEYDLRGRAKKISFIIA